MQTDISIIVCTYNRCESVRILLQNLERQNISPSVTWEILLVDNNSNDQTKSVVESFIANGAMDLRYIFEGRQGKTYALNAGIALAKGGIIAFTDDDVTLDPDWILQLKAAFDEHQCMGVGGKIIPVWTCERPNWFVVNGSHKLMTVIIEYDLGEEAFQLTVPAWGANMAFRKRVFDEHGLFRTDLTRCEDTEFCRRLINAGESFFYAPKAIVYHPVEEKRTNKKYFLRWYFDYGRAVVRVEGIPKNAICYYGVPRYLFKQFLVHCVKFAISFNSTSRFYHKLSAYMVAGKIREAACWAALTV